MPAIQSMGTSLTMGGFTVGQVTSISAVNLSADLADTTALDSTGSYETALSTVLRTGELTFSVVWDPDLSMHGSGAQEAFGKFENQGSRNMVLVFSNANESTWTILGYVTAISVAAEMGDALRADITVKTTGAGTFAV